MMTRKHFKNEIGVRDMSISRIRCFFIQHAALIVEINKRTSYYCPCHCRNQLLGSFPRYPFCVRRVAKKCYEGMPQ